MCLILRSSSLVGEDVALTSRRDPVVTESEYSSQEAFHASQPAVHSLMFDNFIKDSRQHEEHTEQEASRLKTRDSVRG